MGTPTLDKVDEYSDIDEQDVAAALSTGGHDEGGKGARESDGGGAGWKPAFLRKHEEKQRRASLKRGGVSGEADQPVKSSSSGVSAPPRFNASPSTPMLMPQPQPSQSHPLELSSPVAPLELPLGAVPATPSLIRAYNRITQAQQEAHTRASASFSSSTRKPVSASAVSLPEQQITYVPDDMPPPLRMVPTKVELDDSFWTKVRLKAAEYRGRPQEHV